jgi:hypothetical protein
MFIKVSVDASLGEQSERVLYLNIIGVFIEKIV